MTGVPGRPESGRRPESGGGPDSTPLASGLRIRAAAASDVPVILELIRGLAAYEKLADEVVATEEGLRDTLFGPRPFAEVVLAAMDEPETNASVVGFALFFHNYSTFLGRPGIYLEDLYVRPEARGNGVGEALLRHLAEIATERGCGRLEWSVLDWNEPAIEFYKRLGAISLDGWTLFRVAGDRLESLAERPER